jgi:predicted RNA-binding Zn-ribbon protein involved in translation (DUF1610 family)
VSRAILRERTARKPHECTFCLRWIKPGERYVSSVLPPGGELGNVAWWRLASHGYMHADCPSRQLEAAS